MMCLGWEQRRRSLRDEKWCRYWDENDFRLASRNEVDVADANSSSGDGVGMKDTDMTEASLIHDR